MLHVSLSFAAGGGGSAPVVSSFDLDGLLPELGAGSQAARFDLPADAGDLATYLARIVADASVRHPDFGSDLDRSYFDFSERPPTVTTEGGELTVRINLSTNHGRYPAQIELESQQGLEKIGMDHPVATAGADTGFSGSGGPTFDADTGLFDEVYTRMIDAVIEQWGGDEAGAIAEFNRFFNCVGLEDSPIECSLSMIHTIVVTPAFPTIGASAGEPDVADLRGASTQHDDERQEGRRACRRRCSSSPTTGPRSSCTWRRIRSTIRTARPQAPRHSRTSWDTGCSACPTCTAPTATGPTSSTWTSTASWGRPSSRSHFCAYNQRIKGWLADDATLLIDRPAGSEMVDREVVLIQLEHWDPSLDEDARATFAHSLLQDMQEGTPVVAAVFLRLGGDGRLFDILELRGRGELYSQDIDPPRVLITNAMDPEDDTRYAETELEGAGTTEGVLEAYRRKVHLLSSDLRAVHNAYDFAADAEFPEVGLRVEVLEWGTGSTGSTDIAIALLRIRWDRGPAIDLGFAEGDPRLDQPGHRHHQAGPDRRGRQLRVPRKPGGGVHRHLPVPAGGEGTLNHKVAVRVWNFGDATALNVQVRAGAAAPRGRRQVGGRT